jgi:hypothetical protein
MIMTATKGITAKNLYRILLTQGYRVGSFNSIDYLKVLRIAEFIGYTYSQQQRSYYRKDRLDMVRIPEGFISLQNLDMDKINSTLHKRVFDSADRVLHWYTALPDTEDVQHDWMIVHDPSVKHGFLRGPVPLQYLDEAYIESLRLSIGLKPSQDLCISCRQQPTRRHMSRCHYCLGTKKKPEDVKD